MFKFINNTKGKIWIEDYCFAPGESIVREMSADKIEKIKLSMTHPDWKAAIDSKLIVVDYDYKEAVKK